MGLPRIIGIPGDAVCAACGTIFWMFAVRPIPRRVAAAPDPAAKAKVVDEFMACVQTQGTPLVEKATKDRIGRAIFLYRGPATLVALAGDMNGWTPNEAFTQVRGTNLF